MSDLILEEFSAEFMQGLGRILEICKDGNTDNVSLEFDVNGHTLITDIQFRIKEEEWQ